MTEGTSTLEDIARLSGTPVGDLAEHLEEAGLLRADGTGTRLAHLVGAAVTTSSGELLWNLDRLETAVREGLDQPPPQGIGLTPDGGGTPLSSDERILLSSGWTFDARRDAFEADLLRRMGKSLFLSGSPTSMSWHDGSIVVSSADGITITAGAEIDDDGMRFHEHGRIGLAAPVPIPVVRDAGTDHAPLGITSPVVMDSHDTGIGVEADLTRGTPPTHEDRQSAWTEALATMRRRNMTATATACAAGLRMNEITREALLRGGIPTDHVLFAICDAMGVPIAVERNPKGTPGDPRHYPRLAEAITRRATMTIVSRGEEPHAIGGGEPKTAPADDPAPAASNGDPAGGVDAGKALLRILTTAATSDTAIAGMNRRAGEARNEAAVHRRRADAADDRSAQIDGALAGIRSVIGIL